MNTTSKTMNEKMTLPADPTRAMQEMMDTIDNLRAIYIEENNALHASQTRAFMDLQPKKLEITRAYHDGISQMVARRQDFKSVSMELKSKFRSKQEEFSLIAEENLAALDRMRRSVNRLNERIMSAARKAIERDGVNYSNRGKMQGYNSTAPVTLNESA